jgi:DNA-binding GntR family transcriptional regulator
MSVPSNASGDLLVDRVVELLRDRIVAARYAPGEPLPRRRLAEELNLGATVVGEALRVLRREGLVFHGRHGEICVCLHDHSLLLDAFELRYVLDGLAARRAAEHGGPLCAAAKKALADQRAAIAGSDIRRFASADIAFHDALLHGSGNALLPRCISLVRWTSLNAPWDGRRMRLAFSEHQTIFAAVRIRDAAEAERAAQAHIRLMIDDALRAALLA